MFTPAPFEVVELLPGNKACMRLGDQIDIVALSDVTGVSRGDFVLVNDGVALTKMSREEAQSMIAAFNSGNSDYALAG